jgi:hypothetical protein
MEIEIGGRKGGVKRKLSSTRGDKGFESSLLAPEFSKATTEEEVGEPMEEGIEETVPRSILPPLEKRPKKVTFGTRMPKRFRPTKQIVKPRKTRKTVEFDTTETPKFAKRKVVHKPKFAKRKVVHKSKALAPRATLVHTTPKSDYYVVRIGKRSKNFHSEDFWETPEDVMSESDVNHRYVMQGGYEKKYVPWTQAKKDERKKKIIEHGKDPKALLNFNAELRRLYQLNNGQFPYGEIRYAMSKRGIQDQHMETMVERGFKTE